MEYLFTFIILAWCKGLLLAQVAFHYSFTFKWFYNMMVYFDLEIDIDKEYFSLTIDLQRDYLG